MKAIANRPRQILLTVTDADVLHPMAFRCPEKIVSRSSEVRGSLRFPMQVRHSRNPLSEQLSVSRIKWPPKVTLIC